MYSGLTHICFSLLFNEQTPWQNCLSAQTNLRNAHWNICMVFLMPNYPVQINRGVWENRCYFTWTGVSDLTSPGVLKKKRKEQIQTSKRFHYGAKSKEKLIQAEGRNCMWQISVMTVVPSQTLPSHQKIHILQDWSFLLYTWRIFTEK